LTFDEIDTAHDLVTAYRKVSELIKRVAQLGGDNYLHILVEDDYKEDTLGDVDVPATVLHTALNVLQDRLKQRLTDIAVEVPRA
jgi:hypothetical protein